MSHPSKFVEVYQWSSKTIYQIPAVELAPGMIEVYFAHLGRTCWTDAAKLCSQSVPAPSRCSPFDAALREQVRLIQKRLSKVYPLTLRQWEDGFRRDRFPEREITFWLRLSALYAERVKERRLNPAQRVELFRVLLQCLCASHDHVMQTVKLEELSPELAREAVDSYYRRQAEEQNAACVKAGNLVGIPGHVPSHVGSLNDAEVRDEVQKVSVILGVDAATENVNVFYGEEVLGKIVCQGGSENISLLSFLYDSRTDELEYLCAAVRQLKGSCCYSAEAQR